MAYSEKVLEHYENPRNIGSFDKNDPTVGTGLVGASCEPGRSVGLVRRSALDWVVSLRAVMVAQSPLPGFGVRKGDATPRGGGRRRRRISS